MRVTISDPRDRIIVPLDVSDAETAESAVTELAPYVGGFKVGYQLGYSIGWDRAAAIIQNHGSSVFLDPKLNDIPNTISEGTKALAKLMPWMINVHGSSGTAGIRACVENKGSALVLVVTVLTSLEDGSVRDGFTCQHVFNALPQEAVDRFAFDALRAGADGLICSPLELAGLREVPDFEQLMLVTPGVRPEWASVDDQKRVMTPGEAVKLGADYLVIGRPILKPPAKIGSRIDAAKRIADEIASAA